MNDIATSKKERFLTGGTLRVVDLFSGAGGLSLGFQVAGFDILGGVEHDPIAAQTHAMNFHGQGEELYALHAQARDITKLSPDEYIRQLCADADVEGAVDVLVGGPPCQAFARVGRAKLREVAEHPNAFKQDDRARLYISYLNYVKVLKPLVVVIENVPDIMNYGGHNIAAEICETLNDLGYESRYTLLNSAYYGVPQMRERLFLVGIHKMMGVVPSFPVPTHWVELPAGYEGSRRVAFKTLEAYKGTLFSGGLFTDLQPYRTFLIDPPKASNDLPRAVTVQDAIGDLPSITTHLEGRLRRGARRFTELASYRDDVTPSDYAVLMRTWKGFESDEGVYDHVIRYLPRDYAIFRRMRPGDQYPQAHQHALDLFRERVLGLRASGEDIAYNSARFLDLRDTIVPPYDPGKFPNKWRKLEPDMPSRTLMAHLGKDSYSHIHYDSEQARTISVREAARLQSFPDGFRFAGTMNPALRQIGNAVPPLMAKAVASHLLEQLVSTAQADNLVIA